MGVQKEARSLTSVDRSATSSPTSKSQLHPSIQRSSHSWLKTLTTFDKQSRITASKSGILMKTFEFIAAPAAQRSGKTF